MCFWYVSILLKGVEGKVVWYYTIYVVPWHGIFVILLEQRVKRHTTW
jgi:hypothetical protein